MSPRMKFGIIVSLAAVTWGVVLISIIGAETVFTALAKLL